MNESSTSSNVNVFWDNSNIWLVGKNIARAKGESTSDFRIHFEQLLSCVAMGRNIPYAYVCGSIPPESDSVWQYFRSLGVVVDRQERGESTGGEIAVDEAVQLAMANRMLDVDVPETIALLTGDGAGYRDGKGFIRQLERAIKHKWKIELYCWGAGLNRTLRDFVEKNGRLFILDKYYDNISFVANGRKVKRI